MLIQMAQRILSLVAAVVNGVMMEGQRAVHFHIQLPQDLYKPMRIGRTRSDKALDAFEFFLEFLNLRLDAGVFVGNEFFHQMFPMGDFRQFPQPRICPRKAIGHGRLDLRHAEMLFQGCRHIGGQGVAKAHRSRRFGHLCQFFHRSQIHDIVYPQIQVRQHGRKDIRAPKIDDIDQILLFFRGILAHNLPQNAMLRGIKAGTPVLGPETFAGKRHHGYPQFCFLLVRNAFDILTDNPRSAGGGDKDGLWLIALEGIVNGLPQFIRRTEHHVALNQIGVDDAQILGLIAAHDQAIAVNVVVDGLSAAAANGCMLNQHRIADIARLAFHHLLTADGALRKRPRQFAQAAVAATACAPLPLSPQFITGLLVQFFGGAIPGDNGT